MRSFLRTVTFQVEQARPDKLFLMTDDIDFARALIEKVGGLPVLVASSQERVARALEAAGVPCERAPPPAGQGFHALEQATSVLSSAFASGRIDPGEVVLAVVYSNLRATFTFNVDDVGLVDLRREVAGAVSPELLEVVMQIAFEVAHEGREGSHVGALFVIGDTENVLKHSRPRIINPFHGHPRQERLVYPVENRHTIKQYAQLDGATLISEDGVVEAAGRYVQVNWDVYLQGGLGGRHLAGASISKDTKAVAVVVSSSNVIRVFKGGEQVYRVNAP
jgi:DNA integrity scanning protein DisA with diadenylate cyclase activity